MGGLLKWSKDQWHNGGETHVRESTPAPKARTRAQVPDRVPAGTITPGHVSRSTQARTAAHIHLQVKVRPEGTRVGPQHRLP
jgi:hypothetical protein